MTKKRAAVRRLRVAIRIAVIVLGLAAYGFFGLKPKLEAIEDLDRRIETRESHATRRRAEFARVQRFAEMEEDDVRRRERALLEQIPLRDASGVSDILDRAATACGLRMIECRMGEPLLELDAAAGGSGDRHHRVPVEAELRGRYKGLPEFIRRISEERRAIQIEGLKVERDDGIFPEVRIRLHLRTFFVEPPESEKGER